MGQEKEGTEVTATSLIVKNVAIESPKKIGPKTALLTLLLLAQF